MNNFGNEDKNIKIKNSRKAKHDKPRSLKKKENKYIQLKNKYKNIYKVKKEVKEEAYINFNEGKRKLYSLRKERQSVALWRKWKTQQIFAPQKVEGKGSMKSTKIHKENPNLALWVSERRRETNKFSLHKKLKSTKIRAQRG